jgi:quinolinate synthase
MDRPSVADTEAARAVASDPQIGGLPDDELVRRIDELRRRRDAVILAHNYQIPAIQDLADFVGDSLQLSQQSASVDAPLVVFCGVHFMAETAALLCPDKRVLIPDPEAGCSLADSVTAEQVRAWKAEHPGAVAIAYVNTSADVKAEVDVCCTSSNAVQVVRSIPMDREVLFLPDRFLGRYVELVTGRPMHLWPGECHVHAGIRADDVRRLLRQFPDADLLLHPECGCVGECLYGVAEGELSNEHTFVLSTGGMVHHARECPSPVDLVGTEVGLLHRLRKDRPEKRFVPVKENAICEYMKTITLPKLYRALRDDVYVVTGDDPVASRARRAIEAMLALSR